MAKATVWSDIGHCSLRLGNFCLSVTWVVKSESIFFTAVIRTELDRAGAQYCITLTRRDETIRNADHCPRRENNLVSGFAMGSFSLFLFSVGKCLLNYGY